MSGKVTLTSVALAVALAACDRSAPTATNEPTPDRVTVSPEVQGQRERAAMDRLAQRLARALADPAFGELVRGELERSPFREHKLQLQQFLSASERRAFKQIARLNREPETDLQADVEQAIPLEFYFPVPAHRIAWTGGPDVLVASAREDHEAPVAYDVAGRRQVLSPDVPPTRPVLALVPVETDFAHPHEIARQECTEACGGSGGTGTGTGTTAQPVGIYLSYAHFVQDFEGWLKGDPEFEIHILGQAGSSDSLKDYQCAGGAAGGSYHFDQNDLDWSGSVLLFSQTQINNYRAAHPTQNFRIIALEDDDGACVIKLDGSRFKTLITTIQTQYPNVSGAKDTASTLIKWVKRANALQKILSGAYSFLTTQDDLIGNALEDAVVGQTYPGANWIVKGNNNVTNGWLKLEMR
jgi:hypothetical protein